MSKRQFKISKDKVSIFSLVLHLINGVDVNQSLIGAGLAWQYQKYCKASFCGDWLRLEKKAKSSGVGLWADKNPVPPWDWRKGARNSDSQYKKQKGTTDTNTLHPESRIKRTLFGVYSQVLQEQSVSGH